MTRGALSQAIAITAAVEGIVDEAVAQRLIEHIEAEIGPVYGRHGKDHLRRNLGAYNQAPVLLPGSC